jgi:hypothetical protein
VQPDAAPDFYLSSSEHRGDLARVRGVRRGPRLAGPHDAEYLLASVEPPIIGQQFGLGGKDIDLVVLSPHYEGDSLFPVRRYPLHVYIYRMQNADAAKKERLDAKDVELIAWGEVYSTEEAARAAQKP